VDVDAYKAELDNISESLERFGDRLPARLLHQLEAFKQRLG
jgi:GTP-dependent phosphoenolpyruvate carboxykinase